MFWLKNKPVSPHSLPFSDFETKRHALDANKADFASEQANFEANQADFDHAICTNSFASSVCKWFTIFLVRNCRSADLLKAFKKRVKKHRASGANLAQTLVRHAI